MLKSELLELLKDIEDTAEVDELLKGNDTIKGLYKPLALENLGVEEFKTLLASNKTVQAYNQSTLDSAISKGVESFKANKMPLEIKKAVDEAVKAKSNEGKEPWQIEMEQLKADLAAKDKKIARDNLAIKFSTEIAKENLSPFQAHILSGETEEEILANIQYFKDNLNGFVNTAVESRLKGTGYTPPKSNNGGSITKEQFKLMGYKEKVKIFEESPELYKELMK